VVDRLTFLGHSTVLVDLDGVRVLTDPLFGHLAVSIRRQVPPVDPGALVRGLGDGPAGADQGSR
jgi:L-ascorbate metabolism protein UlaG (beta-lactamase superfamily)